jgi:hypothetical protein
MKFVYKKITKTSCKSLLRMKKYRFSKYVVTKDGTVYSIVKDLGRHWYCIEMHPFVNRDKYVQYTLTDDMGKKRKVQAHRIVAICFLGDMTDDNMDVNHKNGNRFDNSLDNLEWMTRSDNLIHRYRVLGGVAWNKGLKGVKAKYRKEKIKKIEDI